MLARSRRSSEPEVQARFRWTLPSALPTPRFSSFSSKGFQVAFLQRAFFIFLNSNYYLAYRVRSAQCAPRSCAALPRMPTCQSPSTIGSSISCSSCVPRSRRLLATSLSRLRWISGLAARVHESNGEEQGHQARAKEEARGGAHQGRSREASSVCFLRQQR